MALVAVVEEVEDDTDARLFDRCCSRELLLRGGLHAHETPHLGDLRRELRDATLGLREHLRRAVLPSHDIPVERR